MNVGIPVHVQSPSLRLIDERDVVDRAQGIVGDSLQQSPEVGAPAFNCAAVKQISGIFEYAIQSRVGFENRQIKVHFGGRIIHLNRNYLKLAEMPLPLLKVLQIEADLK